MLMGLDMMKYSKSLRDGTFEFDVKNAGIKELKKAKAINESGLFLYGHDIFINISEIEDRLKELEGIKAQ